MQADNLERYEERGKRGKLIHLLHELCMLCLTLLLRSQEREAGNKNLSSGSEVQPHDKSQASRRRKRDESMIPSG